MSKPKRRQKYPNDSKVIDFKGAHDAAYHQGPSTTVKKLFKVDIVPRNTKQEEYVELLNDSSERIVFAMGPAGTGKTLLSVLTAIKALKEGKIKKIIMTRPAIEVANEKIGHLPGTMEEKMAPWTRPIMDIFNEYYRKTEISEMIEEGVIEISPLAFMRGRTFKDAYILADEMQNTTPEQMKMLLTRMGDGSRCFVTGDPAQTDIRGTNGLSDFIAKIGAAGARGIALIAFERRHIERDPIVSTVLDIYDN